MANHGLYLDIQATQSAAHSRRGIARFVTDQSKALLRHQSLVRGLGLNPRLPFPSRLDEELLAAPQLSWATATEFRTARKLGPLAYYVMSPFELASRPEWVLPPHAMQAGIPVIVTLYDLIPLVRPSYYLGDEALAMKYRTRLAFIRQADLVLTISDHTRRDAIELLGIEGSRVHTIGAGVSAFFGPTNTSRQPRQLLEAVLPKLRGSYLLTVGGAEERKNIERLIEAYSLLPKNLRSELQLVIACSLPQDYLQRWLSLAAQHGLSAEEILFSGYISDEVLRALYQCAELFVFPSLYEGFGLPPAEAAACGCPTITSGTSSLPEILQFPPATFNPLNPSEIAVLMEKAITNSDFLESLKTAARGAAARHKWESVADKTIEALGWLPAPRKASRGKLGSDGPRVALVGPFSPTRSGIADYNTRLVPHLGDLCDLDIFPVTKSDRDNFSTLTRVRSFPIEAFGTTLNPASYDAVIYSFGNSVHHHRTYELAKEHPGVLWLHDVRLGGFYISYGGAGRIPISAQRFLADKVEFSYGNRAPAEFRISPPLSAEDYVQSGIGMTKELVRSARAVVVNSAFAERLLSLDQGPLSPLPSTRVIPLAVPQPEVVNSRTAPATPFFASFGIVAPVKAPELLLRTLELVRRTHEVNLALVGPIEDSLREHLEEKAGDLGLVDNVRITGSINEEDYWGWLGQAVCAVQLRTTTNGESSAAINDCLAAGVPVITNLAACAEMPPNTVDLVEPHASPEIVAGRIRKCLESPSWAAQLTGSARTYAKTRTFRKVAGELMDLIVSLEAGETGKQQLRLSEATTLS